MKVTPELKDSDAEIADGGCIRRLAAVNKITIV